MVIDERYSQEGSETMYRNSKSHLKYYHAFKMKTFDLTFPR